MAKARVFTALLVVVAGCHAAIAGPSPKLAPARSNQLGPVATRVAVPKPHYDAQSACSATVAAVGRAAGAARPYSRAPLSPPADPRASTWRLCASGDGFCDTVDDAPPSDACFVANENIARAERGATRPSSGAIAQSRMWDGKSVLLHMDRIDAHLHLNEHEWRLLRQNGFVVLDRLEQDSYANAYHDIFQQQLPVFVSIDSVLHSIFQSNSMLLERIELESLGPKLGRMLERLKATLARSKHALSSEALADLDVYISTAHALLWSEPGEPATSSFGNDARVNELLALLTAPQSAGLSSTRLFGRDRMLDTSQYVPRGHYATDGMAGHHRSFQHGRKTIGLDRYFRAMTWLSRLELNLVSRPCPSSQPGATCVAEKTPRETRAAIALAEIVQRAGIAPTLDEIERVYAAFGGAREDVSISELSRLAKRARTTSSRKDAPTRLAQVIGDGHQRRARVHYMPEGAPELPVITTMIGVRITPDIAPLTRLVHDELRDRFSLSAADVGYLLGHDRAKRVLATEIERHPGLPEALDLARSELSAATLGKPDLFSSWLGAILALARPADGAVPSFMRREAYADMRLGSALVAYGQLRHNYVLMAGQGYDAYGCEIPDGYVEPALATYDALLAYVGAARKLAPRSSSVLRRHFERAERVLGALRAIVSTQKTGAPLSDEQKRFLGMVAEYTPAGGYADSGAPPKYTGWYFDLFVDREIGARDPGEFVADYFTLTNIDRVRHLGAERPRLGVFVIDVGGEPRAMVGPVAKGYELATTIAGRLGDLAVSPSASTKSAFWRTYFAPNVAEPPMAIASFACESIGQRRIVIHSPHTLGPVSVRLLDHHGDALTETVTQRVGPESAIFAFALSPELFQKGVEGLHVHVREPRQAGIDQDRFDFTVGPSAFSTEYSRPERQLATGRWDLGAR